MNTKHRWASGTVVAAVAAVACALASCGGSSSTAPRLSTKAYLRVFNTWPAKQAIDLIVNDTVQLLALGPGELSPPIPIEAGTASIALRQAGNVLHAPATRSVALSAGDTAIVFGLDSAGILNSWVLTDTGATVAAGKSKLRVVHFASSAPKVLFYRSQPDHTAPVDIMFPFPYANASPYLESTAGNWKVYMSSEQYSAPGVPVQTDTIAVSGTISIPAGESRTVVFYDAPNVGIQTMVLTP